MRGIVIKVLLLFLSLFAYGQILTVPNGGTGSSSAGVSGQVPVSDGTKFVPADPIISLNYVNLITTQAATATVIGTAARNPIFSSYGTLFVTFASITGSSAGCTIQLTAYDSLGNGISNGSAFGVTVANGTTTFTTAPTIAFAAKVSATFACNVYASAGTISVDYIPGASTGQSDAQGRQIVTAPFVELALAQLIKMAAVPGSKNGNFVRGSFGRAVTSTGDALDVNVKYPAAVGDPCMGSNKTNVAISTSSGTTLLIPSVGAVDIHICSFLIIAASAVNISLIEGTGSTCATGSSAIVGSTTAANGMPVAANGGLTFGNGGGSIADALKSVDSICLLQSGTALIAGNLVYAF